MQQLWMCGQCHSLNEATARRCYRCRADRATQEYVDPRGSPDGPGIAAVPARDPSILGALILGLAAAAASTGLWYWWDTGIGPSGGFLGRGFVYIGSIVGIAIGFGTTLGGRGRTSFPIVVLSVLLTLLALVVGEYLLVSHYVAGQFNAPSNRLVLIDPSDAVAAFPDFLKQSPFRPLMWAFALLAAFFQPWYRLVGRTDRPRD
jgi:hypothetical protein